MPVSLLPQHVALLDASGIDPTVRQQPGYRSATEAAELRELGFSNSQQVLYRLWSCRYGVSTVKL